MKKQIMNRIQRKSVMQSDMSMARRSFAPTTAIILLLLLSLTDRSTLLVKSHQQPATRGDLNGQHHYSLQLLNPQHESSSASHPEHPSQLASNGEFPGIHTREVGQFCSARPSLPIDVAAMIVHVKRNTSFNYKLYLFSKDYVFQTGQIVPRDDFRIHAFPVKAKRMRDFWPSGVSTFIEEARNVLKPIGSELFQWRRFFNPVAVVPVTHEQRTRTSPARRSSSSSPAGAGTSAVLSPTISQASASASVSTSTLPTATRSKILKRSTAPTGTTATSSTTSSLDGNQNLNENIDFDRDDQVSLVNSPPRQRAAALSAARLSLEAGAAPELHGLDEAAAPEPRKPMTDEAPHHRVVVNDPSRLRKSNVINDGHERAREQMASEKEETSSNSSSPSRLSSHDDADDEDDGGEAPFNDNGSTLIPVGAFSSFHVNTSYFVRKDFGHTKCQLIRVGVNANQFKVTHVTLIKELDSVNPQDPMEAPANDELVNEDYQFLTHKLLIDKRTRITGITQIYHDWITHNFYTIVYIQRLATQPLTQTNDNNNQAETPQSATKMMISNDRLIFRGSSANLLGAVQLDYGVRASAFITDKNGLHYFLDFLNLANKFHLAAVDWNEKPFKFIDSQRFPITPTKTTLDNEELLLCPPAICHSTRPLDEIVAYGRLALDQEIQEAANILSGTFVPESSFHNLTATNATKKNHTSASSSFDSTNDRDDNVVDLDKVIAAVQVAAAQLKVKLHLRDWTWQLEAKNTSAASLLHPESSATDTLINEKNEYSISSHIIGPAAGRGGDSAGVMVENGTKALQQHTFDLFGAGTERVYHWRYNWAHRNEIKAKQDIYGYPLTGQGIEAAFRVYNQLHLISDNLLISINYTQLNETIIRKRPIGEEFRQLSSTLIDPISGAFYDRYTNQVFFFKGDRYIGFDYATRKPLDDFILSGASDGNTLLSLPVVGILGRQLAVDGVYHDLVTDLVHVFTGMRYHTFSAKDFKNGSFKLDRESDLPELNCVNIKFLSGCHFDNAFPNPCRDSSKKTTTSSSIRKDPLSGSRTGKSYEPTSERKQTNLDQVSIIGGKAAPNLAMIIDDDDHSRHDSVGQKVWPQVEDSSQSSLGADHQSSLSSMLLFDEKQQEKVRGLLARSKLERSAKVLSSSIGKSAESAAGVDTEANRQHERALIYMLGSLVLLTIGGTFVVVIISLYSNNSRHPEDSKILKHPHPHPQSQLSHCQPYPSLSLPPPSAGPNPIMRPTSSNCTYQSASTYDTLAQLQASGLKAAKLESSYPPGGAILSHLLAQEAALGGGDLSTARSEQPSPQASAYLNVPTHHYQTNNKSLLHRRDHINNSNNNSKDNDDHYGHTLINPQTITTSNGLVVKGRRYQNPNMELGYLNDGNSIL